MKSPKRIFAAIVLLTFCQFVGTQRVSAQTCSDQGQPLIIYRNAGPPIIIENGFNPCKEAEKQARKLQRKREKLAKRLEAKQESKETETAEVRP